MNQSITEPVERLRWTRVGLVVFVSYLVAFAERSNIGVAAPLIAVDLGIGIQFIGVLLSAFFWGYILTQIPGGAIAQRVGPTRVIGTALIIAGLASCVTGMLTNYRYITVARVVLGIAEGVIWPSLAVLFIRWFPGQERGRAVSVAQYALPISSVVMAPIAGGMIDAVGWRHMFLLQGIPGVVMGVVFILFLADDPTTARFLGEGERAYIVSNRDVGTNASAPFSEVVARPVVWLLGLASLCWIMVIFSFGLWMPSLIKHYIANGYTLAGVVTAIPFVFGAISMYFNAYLSDRARVSKGWFVALPNIVAGLALLGQHYGPDTLEWALLMFCIAGAGLYSGAGTWWNYALTMFPRNHAGSAIGLMNVFASFGGIVGPMAVGYFANGSNPATSFYNLAYFLFGGAVIMMLIIYLERQLLDSQSGRPGLGVPAMAPAPAPASAAELGSRRVGGTGAEW